MVVPVGTTGVNGLNSLSKEGVIYLLGGGDLPLRSGCKMSHTKRGGDLPMGRGDLPLLRRG